MRHVQLFTIGVLVTALMGQLAICWRQQARAVTNCDAFHAEYAIEARHAERIGAYELDEYEYSQLVGRGEECVD